MKARVIAKFVDMHTETVREVGSLFVCSKERFDEINKLHVYVEKVEDSKSRKKGSTNNGNDGEPGNNGDNGKQEL